jgi:hypothetical protein
MRTLSKISFSFLIFIFMAFVMGQGLAGSSVYEKVKTENTSDYAGSFASCGSEFPVDEDVNFYVQTHSPHIMTGLCQDMSWPAFNLPPFPSYPVWLPPDNS